MGPPCTMDASSRTVAAGLAEPNTRRPTASPLHPTAIAVVAKSVRLSPRLPPATITGRVEFATTSTMLSAGEAKTVLTMSTPRSAAMFTTWESRTGSDGSVTRGPRG